MLTAKSNRDQAYDGSILFHSPKGHAIERSRDAGSFVIWVREIPAIGGQVLIGVVVGQWLSPD